MDEREKENKLDSINEILFGGRSFIVSKDTLKPTPETIELVNLVSGEIAKMEDDKNDIYIIDVGTGCGCIGVSIALENPRTIVYLLDISRDALDIALKNINLFSIEKRVKIMEGNLLGPLHDKNFENRFDIIVSNPPYIPSSMVSRLNFDKGLDQPIIALDGGFFGMNIITGLIDEAHIFLKENGILLLEFGKGQANLVRRLFEKHGGYYDLEAYICDGETRFIKALKKGEMG